MTLYIQVDSELKMNIRKMLGSDTALVELITIISAYNMVSRFLVALDIQIEDDHVESNTKTTRLVIDKIIDINNGINDLIEEG